MNMAWYVAQDGEADVDEEVGAAAGDHVDADGRDYWMAVSALMNDLIWGKMVRCTEDGDDHQEDGGDHVGLLVCSVCLPS